MPRKIHKAHQRAGSSIRRARESLFWPGMQAAITQTCLSCGICSQFLIERPQEPMKSHEIPNRPWLKVSADIFQLAGSNYLVIVDLYSALLWTRLPRKHNSKHGYSSREEELCSTRNSRRTHNRQRPTVCAVVQWWEHSPSTNVARVRFPVLVSCVGWVCCWFSSLLRGFFSGYSGFPPSIKTNISKFQFDLDVKCLQMSPWLGRLGDYSLHYDVKIWFWSFLYLLLRADLFRRQRRQVWYSKTLQIGDEKQRPSTIRERQRHLESSRREKRYMWSLGPRTGNNHGSLGR